MLESDYNDIDYNVKSTEEELRLWLALKNGEEQLRPIEGLVRLSTVGSGLGIHLRYIGRAKTEAEGRADLLTIADAIGAQGFRKWFMGGYSDSPPRLTYDARGIVGGAVVKIVVDVPWLPKGCQVRRETHRTWSNRASYSTYCNR